MEKDEIRNKLNVEILRNGVMNKPYRSDISTNSLRALRMRLGVPKFKDVFILDDFSFPFRFQIVRNRKLNTVFMDDCAFIWDIQTSVREKHESRQHIRKNN